MQTMPTDDDDRTATLEGTSIPQIPKHITADQADALWAEISASGLPDSAKAKLLQRLEEAGKGQPQPQSVVAGVFFCGAQPDEVQRELRALAAHR